MTALLNAKSGPSKMNSGSPDSFEPVTLPRDRFNDLITLRDTAEGMALAAWVRQQYEMAKTARQPKQREWMLNYAFYRSKQNLSTLGPDAGLLAGRLAKSNSKFIRTINRVKPAVRAEIAALVAEKPSATVVPASSEDSDLFAAIAGEQVYEAIYRRSKTHHIYMTAAMWQVVAGVGFIKDFWDPSVIDSDSGMLGDVIVEAPSPFHIFVPDLLEPEIEKQPWVIHAYSKPYEWVKTRFARELEGIDLQASTKSGGYDYENQAFNAVDGPIKSQQPDSCILIEMWVKPGAHPLVPNGGLITMVDNTPVQLRLDGMPYKHGEFPFTKFDNIPNATFYSDTWVTDIVELQKDYNKIRSQIAESIRKVSRIQMLAPKGSIAADKWVNTTGLIIEYTPGMQPPTPFPVQELPSYLFTELQQILTDIEDISGQHQVSKGSAPPGVTAATAISFLQEKDDAYRVPAYHSTEQGFEKLGRHYLSLAVQYWDFPRMVKIVGSNSAFDARMLQGVDLTSATDLRVEAGSALPKSKAARTAMILELMNMGHIPPEEGLKMMEIGGTQNIIENIRQDERQAQRENIKLRGLTGSDVAEFNQQWQMMVAMGDPQTLDRDSGEPLEAPAVVSVNSWDNHEVHIMIHNKFRKSQEYELLDDEVKMLFEQHVEAHKQVMQQAQISQFMDSIPSDGTEEGDDVIDVNGIAGQAAEEQAMMEGQQQPGISQEIPAPMDQEVV